MRLMPAVLALVFLTCPTGARGQAFVLQGSAGPTLVDAGYSLAGGIGVSPTSRVTVLLDVERIRLSSRLRSDGRGGVAGFRGGTLTLAAPQVHVSLLGRGRVGPYGLAGFAVGVSRPTVNDEFPNRVTNDVRALFFGGGVHIPLEGPLDLFADARLILGGEAGELLAVAPLRAGIACRF
jgi:hypothetical protein